MLRYIEKKWLKFEYKHTASAVLVIILTILIINTALAAVILDWFKLLGYAGAFIGGAMLVWTITSAPAVLLLIAIADYTHLPTAIIAATLGSVFGDWVILRFINDEIGRELKPLLKKIGLITLTKKIMRTKAKWLITILGAIIVTLPLPDELGIALMGISHLKRYQVLMICFALDLIGITSVLVIGRFVF